VVVSQLVAERLWPNGDALGKRISMEDQPTASDWLTIVGIVDDIVQYDVKDKPTPAIYQPLAQQKRQFSLGHLAFAAQSDGDPSRLEQAIRGVIREVDPLQPVQSIMSMQSVIAMSIAEPLFQTRLLVLFAVLAVLLAAVGLYGVLAYSVTERTQEIGVRVALGATPDNVAWLVVRRTLTLVVPGIGIGLLVALSVTRLMSKLLYDVTATDPWTFSVVGVVLGIVAVAAGATPAKRASRIDPMTALRME
jgi:putative ABC transport system permease protein